MKAGGAIAIGSDSHITVSPAEDLRMLEYSQRLRDRTRNALAGGPGPVHRAHAVRGGAARAARAPCASPWAPSPRASAATSPCSMPIIRCWRAATEDAALDTWIFSGGNALVKDVFVGGRHVVKDRHHINEDTDRAELPRRPEEARHMIRIGERPHRPDRHPRRACAGPITVGLSDRARGLIPRSAETVKRLLATGDAIYGVNTGFGKLAKTRIAAEGPRPRCRSTSCARMRRASARRLTRASPGSSCCMKLNALAQGASGISLAAMEALAALINADVLPVIPGQGSVGASGDLAPLAHMSLVLIGEGEAMVKGARVPGAEALARRGRCARGARPQGRAGAAQRHAGFDRAGACGPRRGGAQCRGGDPGGRHVGRCRDGLRHALRPAHPCAAPASRASSSPPRITAGCWRAARSAPRISKAMTACRTPIPSAASRR